MDCADFFGEPKQDFQIAQVKFTEQLLKNSGRGKWCNFTSKFPKSVSTTLKIKSLISREELSSNIFASLNRYSNHGGPDFFGGPTQDFEIAWVQFTEGLLKHSGRGKSSNFTSKFQESFISTSIIKNPNLREGLSSNIFASLNRYSNHGGPC